MGSQKNQIQLSDRATTYFSLAPLASPVISSIFRGKKEQGTGAKTNDQFLKILISKVRISRVRLKGWFGPSTGLQISQLPWEWRGSCRWHVTNHRAPRTCSHPMSLLHHTDSCSHAPPRSALLTEDDWLGKPHTQHDLAATGGSWRSKGQDGKPRFLDMGRNSTSST